MQRPALWKALIVSAAVAGLGAAGAGTAVADSGVVSADVRPIAVSPIPADWPFDDLDDLDDLIRSPVDIPSDYVALDDDWCDCWYDD